MAVEQLSPGAMEGRSSGETKNLVIRAVDILENGGDLHRQDIFGNTALHNELLHGESQLIECLLDKHADVNAPGYFMYSPLQLAVLGNKDLDLISKLIECGANLNHKDLSGKTALHMAVDSGSSTQLLQLLLDNGADVNAKDIRGRTPLHCAKDIQNGLLLLNNGASVCEQDVNGETPLHFAFPKTYCLSDSCKEMAELLLDHGKDTVTNVQDAEGWTPVHLAVTCWCDDHLLKKMIYLYNGSMAILNSEGRSPMDLAEYYPKRMRVFTERALKLICANLPVEANNYEFDFSFSSSQREIYLKEVDRMKLHKLGKYSLYDIISKSRDPAYLNNKEIAGGMQTIVESPDLEDNFPSYSHILREMFCKRQKRLLMLNRAQDLFLGPLTIEVKRLVLSYLSDLDLENWIKAQI